MSSLILYTYNLHARMYIYVKFLVFWYKNRKINTLILYTPDLFSVAEYDISSS